MATIFVSYYSNIQKKKPNQILRKSKTKVQVRIEKPSKFLEDQTPSVTVSKSLEKNSSPEPLLLN